MDSDNRMIGQRHSNEFKIAARDGLLQPPMAESLSIENLTAAAQNGCVAPAVVRASFESQQAHVPGRFDILSRALYRRTNNHVLITGDKGVGKTTVVRELALRAV